MKKTPKCCTALVCFAGFWNSSNILLMSRPPNIKCIVPTFFGDRFVEKDGGLCTHNPAAEEVHKRIGGIFVLSGSEL